MEETLIKRRWQAYFHKLLNEEEDRNIVLDDLEHSESHLDFGCCRRINIAKVERSIRKMNKGRVAGPDKIPMKFWKNAGGTDLEWLTGLFNVIFRRRRCPRNEADHDDFGVQK